jgi:DNA-binding Xre family transcriptional regulator
MMDYASFVSKAKSFVVAPAGYGKTHAIATCLKYTTGKQLILTHTHAGVASLKDKIKVQGIPKDLYRVETITSFAQKYVNAFYCADDIPEQENTRDYYPFIIDQARNLFKIRPIQDIIKNTYAGLFVDEYQDCTIRQHNLIEELANILPTRILGDHLQGIFDFNDPMVSFDRDLNNFKKFTSLIEPWRWKNSNQALGNAFKEIRSLLEEREPIDLNKYETKINVLQRKEEDKYIPGSKYNKELWALSREDNLLVIHPNSTALALRLEFTKRFNNIFVLVEAIDGKDFYKISRNFDSVTTANIYISLYNLIPSLFNGSTSRDNWFTLSGIKNKRSVEDKKQIGPIDKDIKQLERKISLVLISNVLKKIDKLPKIKSYRRELLWNLCEALECAEYKDISVYEAMKEIMNRKRRMGKKVGRRCVATTLLTKGLEFDTVVVLDAHEFKCPKHFYVAITRACKKLVIFTNNKILSPYSV